MLNRNPYQNSHSRTNSRQKVNQNSFEVFSRKNSNFLQDQLNQNYLSNLPSPINKVRFQLSPNASRQDVLNYSSNTYIQEQVGSRNNSRAQSPQNGDNFDGAKVKFFGGRKSSVPENKMLSDFGSKIEWENKLKKQQSYQQPSGLKRQVRNCWAKHQNQEQTENASTTNISQHEQYFSEKFIETNPHEQKYNSLARNYQDLQHEYSRIKKQNLKLKQSCDQLMNENFMIKREGSSQTEQLSGQIQALKEQIHRLQIERQQSTSSGRTNNNGPTSRMTFSRNTIQSARGSKNTNQTNDGMVNLFYVQELERQNDQLIQENRRLNSIVMRKLKNSIAT